ncbi:MAG TPA: hypothetical protein VGG33_04750, partial [Polyangia bacterium]
MASTEPSSAESPFADPAGRVGFAEALDQIAQALHGSGARTVKVLGATSAGGAAVAAHLGGVVDGQRPVVYLVPDEDAAEERLADVGFFLPERAPGDDPVRGVGAEQLPAEGGSPYAEMQPDRRLLMRRMGLLFRLARGRGPEVIVASPGALFRRVIPRSEFDRLSFCVESGATVDREQLIAGLVRAGFARVQVVEDPGSFAVRGAVIDLFPPVYRDPIRIELLGDEVESIRLFDAGSQRTLRTLPAVWIHPVRETVVGEGADPRARILAAADAASVPSSKTRHLIEQIEAGETFFGIEALAPAFHREMASVLEYLPADTVFVLEDPDAIYEELRRAFTRLRESADHRRAEHLLTLPPSDFMAEPDEVKAALGERKRVELEPLVMVSSTAAADVTVVHVEAEPNSGLRAELAEQRRADAGQGDGAGSEHAKALREKLEGFVREGMRVRLVANSRAHAERLVGLLKAIGLEPRALPTGKKAAPAWPALLHPDVDRAPLAVLVGSLSAGFRSPRDRLMLIA